MIFTFRTYIHLLPQSTPEFVLSSELFRVILLKPFFFLMDTGDSSSSRPSVDAPQLESMEIPNSSNKDNIPLIKRIIRNYPAGATAVGSSGLNGGMEAGLELDDSFFYDLDEIRILTPIHASSLWMVWQKARPNQPILNKWFCRRAILNTK